jgi:hypothetical protein
MSTDIANILQNNPSLIETGLDEDTLAVAGGGSGNQSKRLSIKGGVFRKMSGGKEIGAIEDRHMNIVIVKMAHTASRTFYSQGYKEGEKVSPVCWSNDSRTPDPEVKTPQAKTCDSCQYSAKNSGSNGMGTGCRLSWRMAVVLPNDPAGDVMQLVLPATSCFGKEENGKYPFRPYVQMLANHNISAGRVITKMQFDTKSPTPKVIFSPVGAVEQNDKDIITRQAKSHAAEQAIKLTVYQVDTSTTDNEEFSSAPAQAPAQTAAPTEAPATDVDEPTLRDSGQPQAQKVSDVSDVVKKWSKK